MNLYRRFLVVKRLNQDMILGKDVLTLCKVKMDFEFVEVRLEIRVIPVKFSMIRHEKNKGTLEP